MPNSERRGVSETQSPASDSRGAWYPGLDGVRAVAVLLVFAVHYLLNGKIGWTGVPIFFVLSGFLITGVLYDNRNEARRFRNFYIRRTLRIFPLFYFIWFCVLIGAIFLHEQWSPIQLLWPIYLGNFARHLVGTIAVDHIYTKIPWYPIEIGHFWSLAVEEQFYLLWPLIVFKVSNRKVLIRICVAVMVIVLLLRIGLLFVLPNSFLQLDFYYRMTFLQADAFLFGGLLALLLRGSEEPVVLRFGPRFFWGALAVFILASWLNGAGPSLSKVVPTTPWVSAYGFTLVDLVAGGLILCALHTRNLLYRVLTFSPLRLLGRYSYGFYVYHVLFLPLRIFHLWKHQSTPVAFLFLCADFLIILAVSAASYHFLEMPFLRLKDRFTVRHKTLVPTSG
jgi:peptidoglycan/LPS O-acetylase OafA/YrhL